MLVEFPPNGDSNPQMLCFFHGFSSKAPAILRGCCHFPPAEHPIPESQEHGDSQFEPRAVTVERRDTHRIHGAAIYGNMDPITIPQLLAHIYIYIPAPWILWDMNGYDMMIWLSPGDQPDR